MSSGGATTDWDVFGTWLPVVTSFVGLLGLSFVSARKVERCFEFKSRNDDVSASSITAGSYSFSHGPGWAAGF